VDGQETQRAFFRDQLVSFDQALPAIGPFAERGIDRLGIAVDVLRRAAPFSVPHFVLDVKMQMYTQSAPASDSQGSIYANSSQ
jgi:hypothetical protein